MLIYTSKSLPLYKESTNMRLSYAQVISDVHLNSVSTKKKLLPKTKPKAGI